jgi:two-component system, NarL family, response regulator NreC
MAISIIIADDHQVVRIGVRSLLEDEADFRVVGEAIDGLEAVQLVERLKPDVLVLDLMMPDLNGLEVLRQVGERSPGTRVVILSMYADEAYVMEALKYGALGYVLKRESADELPEAVRAAFRGRRYLSMPLTERAIEAYAQKAQEVISDPYEMLTVREREILHLAVEGYTSTEIADRLSVSRRTAENHRASLMRKLGLHNQTELILYALRKGIIRPEP